MVGGRFGARGRPFGARGTETPDRAFVHVDCDQRVGEHFEPAAQHHEIPTRRTQRRVHSALSRTVTKGGLTGVEVQPQVACGAVASCFHCWIVQTLPAELPYLLGYNRGADEDFTGWAM